MRIDTLYLAAFGPFTDRTLDLACGEHGVHVVYGRNEAGKSSALRALAALLYGFPEQTTDAFLHSYAKLRVGAALRAPDGTSLTCFRRKGRRNTLSDGDGNALQERALAAMLGHVDRALFHKLFGIDHASLAAGARSLLREHGNEGEALFGAGVGSNAVHQVLAALDGEAQSVFAPRASKPTLNALATKIGELRKAEREASLSASHFDDVHREAEVARRELARVESEHEQALREKASLARIRGTLAPLARRRQALAELARLGDVPRLPDDFAARRADAEERGRGAREARTRARTRIEALEAALADVTVNRELLANEQQIEALRERVSEQRSGREERARWLDTQRAAEDELARACARLPGGAATSDPVAISARRRHQRRAEEMIEEGGKQRAALGELAAQRESRAGDLAARRAALAALADPGDPGVLADAVTQARRAGDLDARIEEAAQRVAEQQQRVQEELAALGRWRGDPEALLCAPLPDEETLRDFTARTAESERERRALAAEREAAEARARDVEAQLEALALRGDLPREEDLVAARRRRDAGWRLLRARWLEGKPDPRAEREYAPDAALDEAFWQAQQDADAIADRLRREAAAVHRLADLSAQRAAAERELESIAERGRALERAASTLDRDWRALWADLAVEPAAPAVMQGWCRRAEALRDRVRQIAPRRDELAELERRRAGLLAGLRTALVAGADPPAADAGGSALAPLLVRAESRLERAQHVLRERAMLGETVRALERECRKDDADVERARAAEAAWQKGWAQLTAELGMRRDASSDELRDHFDALEAVEARHKACEEARRAIARLDAETAAFDGEAAALCRRIAPELASLPPPDAIARLGASLREARDADRERASIEAQLDETRRELEQADDDARRAGADLAALARLAGGVALESLAEVEARDRDHRAARARLAEAEVELQSQADGFTIDALEAAATGKDPDALSAELATLQHRLERELDPRRAGARERKVNAERDLAEMTRGRGDAAQLAQARAQAVAEARAQAARYVRLRLASRVLREQIERFRQQHRDPVLGAAGRYFHTLTGGEFRAVDTDYGVRDEAVLCAVRSEGTRLTVEALSDGTRDQLYLALRLAALDHYLEHAPPIPFVVDDILVHFDDPRARATLRALAEFSRRTQVLAFTHHARIAEDARALAGEGGGVFVHEL